MMRRARRVRIAAPAILVAALALGACGSDVPAGDQVPALAQRLEQVDAAVRTGDLARARVALRALVNDTAQAKVAGRLSDEEADRILDAAAQVLAALPGAATPAPSEPAIPQLTGNPFATPSGSATSSPRSGESNGDDESKDEDERKREKDKEKSEDKNDDKKKDEDKNKEGNGGNGSSSGNGPDDGHGN